MKYKNCSSCNHPNPMDAAWCINCGAAFRNMVTANKTANVPTPPPTYGTVRNQTPTQNNNKVYNHTPAQGYGTAHSQTTPPNRNTTPSRSTPPPPPPLPSRKKSPVLLIICIAVIVALAAVIIALLSRKPSTPAAPPNTGSGTVSNVGSNTGSKNENAGCSHTWIDADCTNPQTCVLCGDTLGSALGHQWLSATYDAPQTCLVCGATTGDKLRPDPVYINELDYFDKYGKVYYHDNMYATYYYNNDWRDLYTPGHVEQPVCDGYGKTFTYGIHMDGDQLGPYYITYNLEGKYSTFSGWCVLPDFKAGTDDAKSYYKYFEIHCDGKCVFTTNTMHDGSTSQYFEIDVTDVETLTVLYPPTTGPNDLAVLCDGLLE